MQGMEETGAKVMYTIAVHDDFTYSVHVREKSEFERHNCIEGFAKNETGSVAWMVVRKYSVSNPGTSY